MVGDREFKYEWKRKSTPPHHHQGWKITGFFRGENGDGRGESYNRVITRVITTLLIHHTVATKSLCSGKKESEDFGSKNTPHGV